MQLFVNAHSTYGDVEPVIGLVRITAEDAASLMDYAVQAATGKATAMEFNFSEFEILDFNELVQCGNVPYDLWERLQELENKQFEGVGDQLGIRVEDSFEPGFGVAKILRNRCVHVERATAGRYVQLCANDDESYYNIYLHLHALQKLITSTTEGA